MARYVTEWARDVAAFPSSTHVPVFHRLRRLPRERRPRTLIVILRPNRCVRVPGWARFWANSFRKFSMSILSKRFCKRGWYHYITSGFKSLSSLRAGGTRRNYLPDVMAVFPSSPSTLKSTILVQNTSKGVADHAEAVSS